MGNCLRVLKRAQIVLINYITKGIWSLNYEADLVPTTVPLLNWNAVPCPVHCQAGFYIYISMHVNVGVDKTHGTLNARLCFSDCDRIITVAIIKYNRCQYCRLFLMADSQVPGTIKMRYEVT